MNLYLAFNPNHNLVAYLFTKVPYDHVLVPDGINAVCFCACDSIIYQPGIETDVWHLVESSNNFVLASYDE